MMNFTNTDCVGKEVCKHLTRRMKAQLFRYVWSQVSLRVWKQVRRQVYVHHNPIKNKIKKELNK
jgi:hypothetical protein